MTSKGAITISHDDLIRMKMRANLLPNCIYTLTQLTQKKIKQLSNIKKARKEQITGSIIPKTSKNAKKSSALESLKRNNWKGDASTKRRSNFSRRKKKNNLPLPTLNFSRTLNKYELSIANCFTLTHFKADNNNCSLKSTSKISIKNESSFITKKPWYTMIYAESTT